MGPPEHVCAMLCGKRIQGTNLKCRFCQSAQSTQTEMGRNFVGYAMEVNADEGQTLCNLTTSTECELQESAETGDAKMADFSGSVLYEGQLKGFSEVPKHEQESSKIAENTKDDVDKNDIFTRTNRSDHAGLEEQADKTDKNPDINKTCEPCSYDNETVKASAFCTECTEYLCKACVRDHKRNKMTRSHQVLLDAEMPISKKPFERLKNLVSCKIHPEREIEYRCADHEEYICSICESRNHRKCKAVEEIEDFVDTSKDRDYVGFLLQTFDQNIDILRKNNEHKVNNVGTLGKDLDVVHDTLKDLVKDASNLLAHVGEESKKRAEYLVDEQQKVLLTSVEKANVLITEQEDEKRAIRTALNYGSPKQLHLILRKMKETIFDVKARMVNFVSKDQRLLRLSITKKDFSSTQICSLDISEEGSQGYILGTTSDDCSVGSDTVEYDNQQVLNASREPKSNRTKLLSTSTAETQTTDDLMAKNSERAQTNGNLLGKQSVEAQTMGDFQGKHVMSSSIQFVGTHNIRQMGCQYVCSINGCVCLDDGILLIDKNNSVLLRLGHNFAFGRKISLRWKPLGICGLDNCTVAVVLESKRVQRYRVSLSHGELYLLGEINIGLHCRAISTAGSNIALLMSDEDYDMELNERGQIEVQVRRVPSGNKELVIDKFKYSSGNILNMNDPRCLLFTDENHILIGEKNYLAEFDEKGCRERYFKSYRGHDIDNIRAITTDNEGNIYVCGTGSNNVHQIASTNFFVNRIIVEDIPRPCCIAFDAQRKRLIIGCQDTDFMYEYQFKD